MGDAAAARRLEEEAAAAALADQEAADKKGKNNKFRRMFGATQKAAAKDAAQSQDSDEENAEDMLSSVENTLASDPQETLKELSAAIKNFESEPQDSMSDEIKKLTEKQKKDAARLLKFNELSPCPDCVPEDGGWFSLCERCNEASASASDTIQARQALFTEELKKQFGPEEAEIEAQKKTFEAMTEARSSALEHRKNQFVTDLIQGEKNKIEADQRHLKTLQRIERRKDGHNTLTKNTKDAMDLTHAAMTNAIKSTDAASTNALNDATARVDKQFAGVKEDFNTKLRTLESDHAELVKEITEHKEETDDKLEKAKDSASDHTKRVKDEIVKQIEEQSKRINKQLSKHDINHKITQKHILHTAGPEPPAEGWMKKNYNNGWQGDVADTPKDKSAAAAKKDIRGPPSYAVLRDFLERQKASATGRHLS